MVPSVMPRVAAVALALRNMRPVEMTNLTPARRRAATPSGDRRLHLGVVEREEGAVQVAGDQLGPQPRAAARHSPEEAGLTDNGRLVTAAGRAGRLKYTEKAGPFTRPLLKET